MPEVFEVADRIQVLRLGERVASFTAADVSMEDVVGAMTGALRADGNGRDRFGKSSREEGER
jgi:simple sugar transport system ATP-binding protein